MVDVTFDFVLLFGGAHVGLVSELVRRCGALGAALEIAAGAVFGWAATAGLLRRRAGPVARAKAPCAGRHGRARARAP